ncbi:HAD-IIIC family phosphatase [Cytobacillus praedii]|uniref:HAD-IIIC family phosphatase n=1 Tax=Cytobacillus praedii TaxID=1742358 RepID=UPI002E1B9763|nr:HAD-IIIC family phosphatase [Cytobacillus praedii]
MLFDSVSFINKMNLLNNSVKRKELKQYQDPRSPKLNINIRIERNFPFEYIGQIIDPLFSTWSTKAFITYSDYDSTFSKPLINEDIDVYILWVDWREYYDKMSPSEAVGWLKSRIEYINQGSNRRVIVNNWPESLDYNELMFSPILGKRDWFKQLNIELNKEIKNISSCEVIDIALVAQIIGINSYDGRNEQVSNYPFSNQFTIEIARHLALRMLPVLFYPRIKALVLDLDDTLYTGVLGESSYTDVIITDKHLFFHQLLKDMKNSGTMLALCTRNEEQDVKDFFEKRAEIKLKWEDFAVVCANWNPKSENIAVIARKLNIDTTAMLFIDDNISELAKAASVHSKLNLLLADPTGKETIHRLLNYPGVYYLNKDESASLRTVDVQSNLEREKLRDIAYDYNTYLSSLKMKITVYENFKDHKNRIYELSHKTNQFNLALKRINEQMSKEVINSPEYKTFTVNLSDVLSDSGIIGVFICKINDNFATFEEILFSCRALGRRVESVSFLWVLKRLQEMGIKKLNFEVQEGLRNAPAIDWLKRLTNEEFIEIKLNEIIKVVEGKVKSHPAEVISVYE